MWIFHQMRSFSKVLVVWRAGVEVLVVCGACCITGDNLGG
jgi:hypothetical protein